VAGALRVLWVPCGLPAELPTELSSDRTEVLLLGPATGGAGALRDCGRDLARFRAAVSPAWDGAVALVGEARHAGPDARRELLLPAWGATLPSDGTPLEELPCASVAGRVSGRTLVLGGAASGKSELAEDLLTAEPDVTYLATGRPAEVASGPPDPEWADRIRRHRERRPGWWRTVETADPTAVLRSATGPVLLDSVGSWLTGVLDRAGAWLDDSPRQDPGSRGSGARDPGSRDAEWREATDRATDDLVAAWRSHRLPVVAVCEEVGAGVVPATVSGRLFADELGRLARRLADESETVLTVVAGRPVRMP
jgi:adenosylcobinamide kinase/adenosylcobinamide-phosphate guanylyltransferase